MRIMRYLLIILKYNGHDGLWRRPICVFNLIFEKVHILFESEDQANLEIMLDNLFSFMP